MIRVLQSIETFISNTDQLIHGVAVRWECGYAMVYSDVDGDCDGAQDVGKDNADAFAQRERLGRVGLRKQESEFVATEAKSGVRRAQRLSQSGSDRPQDVIPTKVTELIIHFLEAVEIQSDKGERLRVALGAIQFLFKRLAEQTAVVEAGKRIGDRVAFERF